MNRSTALQGREWNGTIIRQRTGDGYVNATAMCQANGKRLNHYMANDRTQAYLATLASVVGIPTTGPSGLIQIRQGGSPQHQGTWIHPRLAIDLARWISPQFAVWMDGWFLDWLYGDTTPQQPVKAPEMTWDQLRVLSPTRQAARIITESVEAIEEGERNPFFNERMICSMATALDHHFGQYLTPAERARVSSEPKRLPVQRRYLLG